MYPILARFGPFLIYSFEFVLAVGIGFCVGLAFWLTREKSHLRAKWVDGILLAIILAIIGGRIVFVISEWAYYLEEPGDIWLVWRGGLSYHGALIVGLSALWLWTRWRDYQIQEFVRYLAPPLALISVFGWFACWLEGCAYGKATAVGLFSGDLPDSYGVFDIRYQTQFMGLILTAVVLAIVTILYRRLRPLQLFWLTLAGLAIARLVVTLFRGDEAPMIGAIRFDTAVDGAMTLVALVGLAFATTHRFSRKMEY